MRLESTAAALRSRDSARDPSTPRLRRCAQDDGRGCVSNYGLLAQPEITPRARFRSLGRNDGRGVPTTTGWKWCVEGCSQSCEINGAHTTGKSRCQQQWKSVTTRQNQQLRRRSQLHPQIDNSGGGECKNCIQLAKHSGRCIKTIRVLLRNQPIQAKFK